MDPAAGLADTGGHTRIPAASGAADPSDAATGPAPGTGVSGEPVASGGALAAAAARPQEESCFEELMKAVSDGVVEPPPLLTGNEWRRWRHETFPRFDRIPSGADSRLWRGTMAEFHGAAWHDAHRAVGGAAAAPRPGQASEVPRPVAPTQALAMAAPSAPRASSSPPVAPSAPRGAPLPARPALTDSVARYDLDSEAGSTFTEGSWRDLPVLALRETLARGYEPPLLPLVDYEAQLYRAIGCLAARGVATAEDRTLLAERLQVARMVERCAVAGDKAETAMREDLSAALEADDDNLEARLAVRVLVELLTPRGARVVEVSPPPRCIGARSPAGWRGFRDSSREARPLSGLRRGWR